MKTTTNGPNLDDLSVGASPSRWTADGFDYAARMEYDDQQDVSQYGRIEPHEEEDGERVDGRHGPVWIVADGEGDPEYKDQDLDRLRSYVLEHWSMVGIIVTASRNGIELGSASLWSIESDSGDYLNEAARELAEEATHKARANLAALCAGLR